MMKINERLFVNNVRIGNVKGLLEKMFGKAVSTRHRLRSIYYTSEKYVHRNLNISAILMLLLLLFSIVMCLLFYICTPTVRGNEKTSVADVDHVLPIGTEKNKDYYITRPNGRDDGGVVRVMFMIASTRIDWMLCYAVASAYFTNIPIVVVGFDKQGYNNTNKPDMYFSAIEHAGLQDSDVVLALDSDIMFTGLDYLPFIDKFIKLSPANLNELDAKAIRSGKTMAPSTFGSENHCFSPQTLAFT